MKCPYKHFPLLHMLENLGHFHTAKNIAISAILSYFLYQVIFLHRVIFATTLKWIFVVDILFQILTLLATNLAPHESLLLFHIVIFFLNYAFKYLRQWMKENCIIWKFWNSEISSHLQPADLWQLVCNHSLNSSFHCCSFNHLLSECSWNPTFISLAITA